MGKQAKIASKRVVSFNVPQTEHELVRVQQDEVPYFYDQLHQHPEIQVMLIEQGEGTLVAGDYVGRFQAGDVYVLGGGQPHVFRCDPDYYESKRIARSTSLYFNENYFGHELWATNELAAVRELADASRQGLRLTSASTAEATALIHRISSQNGLLRIVAFFQLLSLFTASKKSFQKLSLQAGRLVKQEEDRMNRILEFTFRESRRQIYLDEVAQLANLSVEAFCRYFKVHTRKTYVNFLQEVRVSQACQRLIRTDKPIQQICQDAGFPNVSHFNRVFRKITGKKPLEFRKEAWPVA